MGGDEVGEPVGGDEVDEPVGGDEVDEVDGHDQSGQAVALTAKVAFLLRRAFPEPPEAIETHMSWVFLTADRVYKLKKPVKTTFLDNRRLQSRRRDCEAEIRLNRPLAPGVYRRTVPLTYDDDRGLALGGPGRVVDWLVVMRRLPEASMLDRRLAAGPGSVTSVEVAALIRHLVGFYRTTAAPTTPERHLSRLLQTLQLDREELLRPHRALDRHAIADLTGRLRSITETLPGLGARSRMVVEGHGDLRPEHVLLGHRPLVIDRITFDRNLRMVDPLYDLALLAVECEFSGDGPLGDEILGVYRTETADDAAPTVTALYRSLRATSRARLSVAHLGDGDREAPKWLDRTDAYLRIADDAIEGLDPVPGTVRISPSDGRSGFEMKEVDE
ncbi:MAG: hypothetical protein WBM50_27270 [Acidimicrobiales bacterium]